MFLFEKEIENEFCESILNDYELLCSMYQDDIIEIINNSHELKFMIKINYETNLNSSIINTINDMKMNELNIENNTLILPYWIQFNYDKNINKLLYKFFIFWIKDNIELIEKIKQELNIIEEPFIYNSIELIKEKIENSLNNSNIISILNEIKLENINKLSIENALFKLTEANKDCEDFKYEEKVKNKTKEEINEINKINLNNEEKLNIKKNEYELFFEKGGIKGEILEEKDYAFQSHAIIINNKEEIDLYKSYLLSNNKIKKATRNIFVYRLLDKNNIIDDYDDDGEHYAGIRILGLLQKMKIYNILILVSRFNGDLHLKQHSTKYLNVAENLIKNNINLFSFE